MKSELLRIADCQPDRVDYSQLAKPVRQYPRIVEPKMTDEDFVDADDKQDYYCWLRLQDLGPEDDRPTYRITWSRSGRRGRHQEAIDRRRRRLFGPGKYWAPTSAGVFLNKTFVKGWRGINPRNP